MKSKRLLAAELKSRKKKKEAAAEPSPFIMKDFCFKQQYEFFRGGGNRFRTAVCSRRSGKCRIEGTLVKTPTGSVKIEDLKPEDSVYGYNSDGSVSLCKVKHVWNQGQQEVVDLVWNRQVMATSTLNHRWLAHNTHKDVRVVKELHDFNSRDKVAEEYTPIPGGKKEIKEAYALGALLGDGCSRESSIIISGEDEEIVRKVAKSLNASGYKRLHKDNYSWKILDPDPARGELYLQWCKGRYAHEKVFDLEEVRSWTRASQIEFVSGLIDTDGSVYITNDGRLQLRLSMQAKSVIEGTQALLMDLFQANAQIRLDDRDKYKNGPVYDLNISNNKFSKRVLRELKTVAPRKQWKPEYEDFNERNTNPNCVGVRLENKRIAQCYDITVDNETNLFLDANGLIGHNTVGIAADMFDTCLQEPNVTLLYITMTKQNARNIIWGDVEKIADQYNLECKTDQTRLSVKFPNGSKINIEGVKDRTEIEKYRGWKLRKCYIDECQSFRPYIAELIKDIIIPALRDLRGELYLTGTPGPVPAGTFYDYSNSTNWENHKWTAFENPHMHDPDNGLDLEETLKEERILFNIDEMDPGYQRETYGIWVEDTDALVFKFNPAKNIYDTLPKSTSWEYIFGIDIGYNDADAIAVLAFNEDSQQVFLVEEVITKKQDITSLTEQIHALKLRYEPIKMVMDAGALGKKIQEELIHRYSLNIHAAEKTRKVEFIELLNDDLAQSKLKAFEGSIFQEDAARVQWDRESKIRNPEKPKISNIFHSDICDAVLYAWRECRHYLFIEKAPQHKAGTDAYMDALEKEEADRMEFRKNNSDWEMQEQMEQDAEELQRLIDSDEW